MIKRFCFSLFISLLLLGCFVSADSLGTFKLNDSVTLVQICDSCSYVTLNTILSPSGVLSGVNVNMSKSGNTFFYVFNDSLEEGVYRYNVCGDKGGSLACESLTFKVTNSGLEFLDGEGSNWLSVIIAISVFSAICVFSSLLIKNKDLNGLKMFLFLFGLINAFVLAGMTYFVSLNPLGVGVMRVFFMTYLVVNFLCLLFIIYLVSIYLLSNNFKFIQRGSGGGGSDW